MKKILLSVYPKYCKLIFNSEKTIEVRRTRPKLEPPFKVYMYETKAGFIEAVRGTCPKCAFSRGKIIGEFVCDKVDKIKPDGEYYAYGYDIDDDRLEKTCLTREDLIAYGNGKPLYGWHITDLKIYDKPKELGEFYTICNKYGDDSCGDCPYLAVEQCSFPCDDCVDTWCSVDNIKPITRPPQSWCYVEEN